MLPIMPPGFYSDPCAGQEIQKFVRTIFRFHLSLQQEEARKCFATKT